MAVFAADPKPKPADYALQFGTPQADFGIEFQVRTVFGERHSFVVDEYLVVEVAAYPKSPEGFLLSSAHFTLRLNGKRSLFSQAPGMVAASLKYPDWSWQRGGQIAAGAGGGGVILGGPGAPVSRFPGDQKDPRTRLPRQPRAESGATGVEIEREDAVEIVNSKALPEGPAKSAVAGYLYFPHKGELKKLKSIELVYQTPQGSPMAISLR